MMKRARLAFILSLTIVPVSLLGVPIQNQHLDDGIGYLSLILIIVVCIAIWPVVARGRQQERTAAIVTLAAAVCTFVGLSYMFSDVAGSPVGPSLMLVLGFPSLIISSLLAWLLSRHGGSVSDLRQDAPERGYPKQHPGGSPEGVTPPQPSSPSTAARPSSVTTAVKLMFAGAALSLISVVVLLFTLDTIKTEIEDSMREADPEVAQGVIDSAYATTVEFGLVFGLAAVGLWVWMAMKNGQGRSWARIVATVLGAFNVLSVLRSFTQPGMTGISTALSVISLILALGILVLLWMEKSSAYYEAVSQAQVR